MDIDRIRCYEQQGHCSSYDPLLKTFHFPDPGNLVLLISQGREPIKIFMRERKRKEKGKQRIESENESIK
jgi:hypothetical protein